MKYVTCSQDALKRSSPACEHFPRHTSCATRFPPDSNSSNPPICAQPPADPAVNIFRRLNPGNFFSMTTQTIAANTSAPAFFASGSSSSSTCLGTQPAECPPSYNDARLATIGPRGSAIKYITLAVECMTDVGFFWCSTPSCSTFFVHRSLESHALRQIRPMSWKTR